MRSNGQAFKAGTQEGLEFGKWRRPALGPIYGANAPRLQFVSRIETQSLPSLLRCYPRSFAFYLGNPFPRFPGS
jgi:hypothetical protein